MNATRSRLISLGLVRPDTARNLKASQAQAILARRQELQRTVVVTSKRSINNTIVTHSNPLAQL